MLSFLSLLLLPAVLAHNISHSRLLSHDGSAKFTNYYAGSGEGACGAWHQDSEFVVALTTLEFDGGANCNKEIYITYNGMSAVAKIVDECMICPWNGLDFSQSLFGHFVGGEQNDYNVGVIYGDWSYGTGPSPPPPTTTKEAPPTTTTKHTTTSTTHTPTTTTSSLSSSASKSASASASVKSTSASASASATAVPTPSTGPENLQDFTQAILNLAGLVIQAPHAG